jgi:hypothetical protein
MPIDWKASTPFKTFIAHREKRHKHPAACSNSQKLPVIVQPQLIKVNKERDIHEAEGTLEMQTQLLQELARQENAAKGLVWQHGKRQKEMRTSWQRCPPALGVDPVTDLDLWKRDVAQALYSIWGRQRISMS